MPANAQRLNLAQKIASLRKLRKLNQKDFADALGTTQSNVSKWEAGASQPSPEQFMNLAKLARGEIDELVFMEHAGVPASWFLEEKQNKGLIPVAVAEHAVRQAEQRRAADLMASDSLDDISSRTRSVPLLRDAAAAGTPRAVEDSEVEQVIAFPRQWLPAGGTLFAITIRGDSMSPELLDGWIVVLDVSKTDPKKLVNKMVVARVDDGLTVKWLRRLDGVLMLMPHDPSRHELIRQIKPGADIKVVGEVVRWLGSPAPFQA